MNGARLEVTAADLGRLRRVCRSESEALLDAAREARALLEHPSFAAGARQCPEQAERARRLVHRAVDGDPGLRGCAHRIARRAEELRAAESEYARAELAAQRGLGEAGRSSNYGKPWGHGWLPPEAPPAGPPGADAAAEPGDGADGGAEERSAAAGGGAHAAHLAHSAHASHAAHAAHSGHGQQGHGGAVSGRRAEILRKASRWVHAHVPYSMYGYHNGWRKDCSGFVSMAWGLDTSMTTVTLPQVSHRIAKAALRPGDILLNTAPGRDGHVVLFDGWTDESHTAYLAYEQSPGGTKRRVVPYPYFPGHGAFEPYRLNSLGR